MKTTNKNLLITLTILLIAFFCTSCHHEGSYAGKGYGNFTEGNTIYIMDKGLSKALSIDGQKSSILPHGALEVKTILRNRLKRPITVECSTVFKDVNGFSLNDETGWAVMTIQPLATKTHISMSTVTNAQKYSVRIRPVTK